ncbi:hypothetical protein HN51_060227 [Arachis hypogaea]|uniref:RING-type domain-containing protein n=1 Tax=Arachis hypogaea TaxID=3818 RepID=A0A444X913_ARAHY|nr:RING-H2 finger protein [Arachis hypogaea]RYQ86152.1 hypothetical protein Ahy_B10g105831 [Arachis hypogaea]
MTPIISGYPNGSQWLSSTMSNQEMSNTTSGGYIGSSNITGYGLWLWHRSLHWDPLFYHHHHPNLLLLHQTPSATLPPAAPNRRQNVLEVRIDEESLVSYPKLLYSEAKKLKKNDSTCARCSICLADYKGSDMLRVLPDCGHQFHIKCIYPWLRLHPACPLCRTSPIPTPLSTPLPQVGRMANFSGEMNIQRDLSAVEQTSRAFFSAARGWGRGVRMTG